MMIKKIFIAILLIVSTLCSFAQSDRVLDKDGNLKYEYNRSATVNPDHPESLTVTFVFINGTEPNAICLRQENLYASVTWRDTTKATTGSEKVVDFITANLKPNESISWSYLFTPSNNSSTKSITLEKAALLIMNQHYAVENLILLPQQINY